MISSNLHPRAFSLQIRCDVRGSFTRYCGRSDTLEFSWPGSKAGMKFVSTDGRKLPNIVFSLDGLLLQIARWSILTRQKGTSAPAAAPAPAAAGN